MMVFSRELPHSFSDALRVCKEILSANHDLIIKNTLDTEAEQIVTAAYRAGSGEPHGKLLSRGELFARLQDAYPEAAGEKLLVYAGRRTQGALLQHVLGFQYFLDHEYAVNTSTLIPRPETEILVVEALRELKSPSLGIEIGLGTGIISIELLHRFDGLEMVASEFSPQARTLARENAERILGSATSATSASRLKIVEPSGASDVFGPFRGVKADFIISNPPYLDARSADETDAEVLRHEPKSALFPEGSDPLFFYREIAREAQAHLVKGGRIYLEIAHERVEATKALFQGLYQNGWHCRVVNDLAGRPRVLVLEDRDRG